MKHKQILSAILALIITIVNLNIVFSAEIVLNEKEIIEETIVSASAVEANIMNEIILEHIENVNLSANYEPAYELPELTGDLRADFIAVAESQLGYTEADDGSTVFGAWAGDPYQAWCSEFTAWCAEKANIPKSIIVRGGYSGEYIDFFIKQNRYYYLDGGIDPNESNFTSKYSTIETLSGSALEVGDLIFTESDGNISNGPDHTAIVLYVIDEENVYAISGNCNNSVMSTDYNISKIHGAAKPNFENETDPTTEATTDADTETTTAKTSSGSSSSGGGGGGGGSSASKFTITIDPNNGEDATTKYLTKNTKLTKPVTPEYEGYTFSGWYTDKKCTEEYDFDTKITQSFTIYAGWKSNSDDEEIEIDDVNTDTISKEISEETEASENIITVVIGSSEVVVQNDEGEFKYTIDAVPYIQASSSSTLVPLRFVSTAVLGKDIEEADESSIVKWDSANKTVTITAGSDLIQFTSGSPYMTVNGTQTLMSNSVKAEIKDGRMYVPFRALGEALGAEVSWDDNSKTASFKK